MFSGLEGSEERCSLAWKGAYRDVLRPGRERRDMLSGLEERCSPAWKGAKGGILEPGMVSLAAGSRVFIHYFYIAYSSGKLRSCILFRKKIVSPSREN